ESLGLRQWRSQGRRKSDLKDVRSRVPRSHARQEELVMRSVLVVVVALFALPATLTAQSVIIGRTEAFAFDYLTADAVLYQLDHFEAQWDGQAWIALGPIAGIVLPDTLPEALSYRVVPPFTVGTHTVALRACSLAAGCGGASSPFDFAYAVVPPLPPGNLRKVPRLTDATHRRGLGWGAWG